MASRRNNPRNRNYQNNDNRGNTRGPHHQSGNSKTKMNQFFCDLCGTKLPKYGNSSPLCPRCMVPMHQLRGGKNKNREFDYSARIYHQTDGHPQYKNLPKDHPDPEDEKAVAEYHAKRERMKQNIKRDAQERANRAKKIQNKRSTTNRRRNRHESRNPSPEKESAVEQKAPAEEKKVNPAAKKDKAPIEPPKRTGDAKPETAAKDSPATERRPRKPLRRRPKKTPMEKTELLKKDEPKEPAAPKEPPNRPRIKEEDYAGTALTSDKSAATILSETLSSGVPDPASN